MKNQGELNPEMLERIEELAEKANEMFDDGKSDEAFGFIMEALELIPEPRHDFSEATWLYATLGDIYFEAEDFEQAATAFGEAVQCPGGLGNPFVHLRLGECAFEASDLDRAADELIRAYMAEGAELFLNS